MSCKYTITESKTTATGILSWSRKATIGETTGLIQPSKTVDRSADSSPEGAYLGLIISRILSGLLVLC